MLSYVYFCLVLGLVVSIAGGQQCQRITGSDLGSSNSPSQSGLIAQSFVATGGDNVAAPFIQILAFHIVCEAAGNQRNTYRYASLIANYTSNSQAALSQFDYQCTSSGVWGSSVAGSSVGVITSPPDADFTTRLRQDCRICVNPARSQFGTTDFVTHCLPCSSSCHSLNRCTSDACCNFYNDDSCVITCPQNSQSTAEYECMCLLGYARNGPACEDIDECITSMSCLNGATCTNTIGSFNCVCTRGYTGSRCEIDIDECSAGINPCMNEATCVYPCMNGGTCSNTIGSFMCSCPAGYTGELCQDNINECSTLSNPCVNGGTCIDTLGSYNCSCMPGYTGTMCEDDVDECNPSNPCANLGLCFNTLGSFVCVCPITFMGTTCEQDVDECNDTSNLCVNGAVCLNTVGSFMCRCASGYTGDMCDEDIDECSPTNPCTNGGTCVNTVGSFSCTCSPGFTGTLCGDDINECDNPSTCMDGGSCVNNEGSFTCVCPQGVTGPTCGEDINECEQDDLCLNGGTCVNSLGSYTCQCRTNWEGPDCRKCAIEQCLMCSGEDDVCEQCDSGHFTSADGLCIPCSVELCSVCTKQECTACVKGYMLSEVRKNECIVGGGGLTASAIIGIILAAIFVAIVLASLVACIIFGVYKGRERPRMKEAPNTDVFAAYGEHYNPMYLDAKKAIEVESGEVLTTVRVVGPSSLKGQRDTKNPLSLFSGQDDVVVNYKADPHEGTVV